MKEMCERCAHIVRRGKEHHCAAHEDVDGECKSFESDEGMTVCRNCGRKYYRGESEAQRDDLFCCVACEYGF